MVCSHLDKHKCACVPSSRNIPEIHWCVLTFDLSGKSHPSDNHPALPVPDIHHVQFLRRCVVSDGKCYDTRVRSGACGVVMHTCTAFISQWPPVVSDSKTNKSITSHTAFNANLISVVYSGYYFIADITTFTLLGIIKYLREVSFHVVQLYKINVLHKLPCLKLYFIQINAYIAAIKQITDIKCTFYETTLRH